MNREKVLHYYLFSLIASFGLTGIAEILLFIVIHPTLMQPYEWVGTLVFFIGVSLIGMVSFLMYEIEPETFHIEFKPKSKRKFIRNMIIIGSIFIIFSFFEFLFFFILRTLYPPAISLNGLLIGILGLELIQFYTQKKAPEETGESQITHSLNTGRNGM